MEYYYSRFSSPVGALHLISNGDKLVALTFNNSWKEFSAKYPLLKNKKDKILRQAELELSEYFSGKRMSFTVPVDYSGTEFQNKAWKSLQKIPFGKTISYGEQAANISNPKAVRAIGRANGQNPICIVIPCHRVIGKDGSLTGFGGGIKIKEFLLNHESREV